MTNDASSLLSDEKRAGGDIFFTKNWKRPMSYGASARGSLEVDRHACLVCGKPPPAADSDQPRHKRCGRCHAATYCSVGCQISDYRKGKHKSNCKLLETLWREKEELEGRLWNATAEGNDDLRAKVGHFWSDKPSTPLTKATTAYCVCLLKLVQILSRGESWRVKRLEYPLSSNTLALRSALNLGLDLLYLDRIDMRVRLLLPSIYIELGLLQNAYDYLKFWLLPSSTMTIMELTQMEMGADEAARLPYLHLQGENMAEPPEKWMDFDLIYTSVGMVFELALIKLKMAGKIESHGARDSDAAVPASWMEIGNHKVKQQAALLLTIVHSWSPLLLLQFKTYDPASEHPAAVDELLNARPPGFDLQFRMGNPGGRSHDEAVAIWQRDMAIWDSDRDAMAFLARFCSDIDANLVKLEQVRITDDETGTKRKEAEALVAKLQKANPDMSADQLMMHPEMALLMTEHSKAGKREGLQHNIL